MEVPRKPMADQIFGKCGPDIKSRVNKIYRD